MTSTPPTIRGNPPKDLAEKESMPEFEIRPTLLLLPLASYLAWAVFAIAWWLRGFGLGTISLGVLGVVYLDLTGLLGLIGIFALAASLGSSFVLYAIMNRINTHSARAQILLSKTVGALENRIGSQPSPALFALNSVEEDVQRLIHAERERSSFLWSLLAIIPFIGWIFVIAGQWLLSRDLAIHVRLEGIVLDDLDRTMRAEGLNGFQSSHVQIRPRNGLALTAILACFLGLASSLFLGFEGALVLVYLIIGVVSLLWIDLSTHDPRGHLRYYSAIASEIAHTLNMTTGPDARPI